MVNLKSIVMGAAVSASMLFFPFNANAELSSKSLSYLDSLRARHSVSLEESGVSRGGHFVNDNSESRLSKLIQSRRESKIFNQIQDQSQNKKDYDTNGDNNKYDDSLNQSSTRNQNLNQIINKNVTKNVNQKVTKNVNQNVNHNLNQNLSRTEKIRQIFCKYADKDWERSLSNSSTSKNEDVIEISVFEGLNTGTIENKADKTTQGASLNKKRERRNVLEKRLIRSGTFRAEYSKDLESKIINNSTLKGADEFYSSFSRVTDIESEPFNSAMKNKIPYNGLVDSLKNESLESKLHFLEGLSSYSSVIYDHSNDTKSVDKLEMYRRLLDAYDGNVTSYGVCRHHHGVLAEIARDIGLKAFAVGVNSDRGPHMVSAIYVKGYGYVVCDYGNLYFTKQNVLSKAVDFYQTAISESSFSYDVFNKKHIASVDSELGKDLNEFVGINRDGFSYDVKDLLLRRNVIDKAKTVVKNSKSESSVSYAHRTSNSHGGDAGHSKNFFKIGQLSSPNYSDTNCLFVGQSSEGESGKTLLGGFIVQNETSNAIPMFRAYYLNANENDVRAGFRKVCGLNCFLDLFNFSGDSDNQKSRVLDLDCSLGLSYFMKDKNMRTDIYSLIDFGVGDEDYNEANILPMPSLSSKKAGINTTFNLSGTRLDLNSEYEVSFDQKRINHGFHILGNNVRLSGTYSKGKSNDGDAFPDSVIIKGNGAIRLGRNLEFEVQYEKNEYDYFGVVDKEEKKLGSFRVRF